MGFVCFARDSTSHFLRSCGIPCLCDFFWPVLRICAAANIHVTVLAAWDFERCWTQKFGNQEQLCFRDLHRTVQIALQGTLWRSKVYGFFSCNGCIPPLRHLESQAVIFFIQQLAPNRDLL
jgi:hypothetical protein